MYYIYIFYIYLYTLNRLIDLVGRVFTNGSGDRVSIHLYLLKQYLV